MLQEKIFRPVLVLLSALLTSCATPVSHQVIPVKEPSAVYLNKIHPKVILVLGSGSARGFAHAGVLKVLEKNHIPIDLIVGTSAGSIVGALYADNLSAAKVEKILLLAERNKVIDFSLLNIMSGPISGTNLQIFINENIKHKTFDKLPIPLIVVAADLESGKIHHFKSGPIAPAVNASSAAPPFFRPVKLYGRTYVDGGVLDPVAVDVAEQFHPKVIIAVNLNHPLAKEFPTNSPEVFMRSFDMMLGELNDYCSKNATIIIRPKIEDISMFEDGQRAQFIKAGELAALKSLPAIKRALSKNHIYPAQNVKRHSS